MTYAISDLHGNWEKYEKLLKTIDFGSKDTLYVLGDVIDRGGAGFRIMLDLAARPNVTCLLGNHEAMAIAALPGLLRAVREKGGAQLTEEEADSAALWFYNGGEVSLADYLWLNEADAQKAWDYMQAMPLYLEITVSGRSFVLVHGGMENFAPERPLSDYVPDEILWCRPGPDTVYYADKLTLLGHTPARFLHQKAGRPILPARFFRAETFIDLDCGCAFTGGRLGCLYLETMEETYV